MSCEYRKKLSDLLILDHGVIPLCGVLGRDAGDGKGGEGNSPGTGGNGSFRPVILRLSWSKDERTPLVCGPSRFGLPEDATGAASCAGPGSG